MVRKCFTLKIFQLSIILSILRSSHVKLGRSLYNAPKCVTDLFLTIRNIRSIEDSSWPIVNFNKYLLVSEFKSHSKIIYIIFISPHLGSKDRGPWFFCNYFIELQRHTWIHVRLSITLLIWIYKAIFFLCIMLLGFI